MILVVINFPCSLQLVEQRGKQVCLHSKPSSPFSSTNPSLSDSLRLKLNPSIKPSLTFWVVTYTELIVGSVNIIIPFLLSWFVSVTPFYCHQYYKGGSLVFLVPSPCLIMLSGHMGVRRKAYLSAEEAF